MRLSILKRTLAVSALLAVMILAHSVVLQQSPAQTPATENPRAQNREATTARLDEAVRAADHITNPLQKFRVFAEIAAAQVLSDHAAEGNETFRKSNGLIAQVDPRLQVGARSWLARAKAKAGDRAGARAILKTLCEEATTDELRAFLLVQAIVSASAGDAEGALQIVNADKNSRGDRVARALFAIAEAQAKAGDPEAARATAERADVIAKTAEKELPQVLKGAFGSVDFVRLGQVQTLAALAMAELKRKQVDSARELTRKALEIGDKIGLEMMHWAVAEIAMVQRAAGDRQASDETLKRAFDIANASGTSAQKADGLARIAAIQGRYGFHDEGRQTLARALLFANGDPNVLKGIGNTATALVVARTSLRDWEGARVAASGLRTPVLAAEHLNIIAYEQTKVGEADAASHWASALRQPLFRAYAFLGIAQGLIEIRTAAASGGQR